MENNELFPIGEVSRLFHISVELLRHYDRIGLLRPEHVDPRTGYRYYSTRQFECLNTIRYLRALDMPLDKIASFLQNRNLDGIHELLLEQKADVHRRQQALMQIERKIDNRLRQIADSAASELDVIAMTARPARRLAILKKPLIPRNYLDLEVSIRELERDERNSVTFLGKVGVGLSAEHLRQGRFQPYDVVFILLDEEDDFQGRTTLLPECRCAAIRFRGGHDQAPEYYEKLLAFIGQNRLMVAGFSMEITLIDYGLTNDPDQFVTEIQIPVEAAAESRMDE